MGTIYIYMYIYIYMFEVQVRVLQHCSRRKGIYYFSAAVRGESVLSMVFTKVFVYIYADLPK